MILMKHPWRTEITFLWSAGQLPGEDYLHVKMLMGPGQWLGEPVPGNVAESRPGCAGFIPPVALSSLFFPLDHVPA